MNLLQVNKVGCCFGSEVLFENIQMDIQHNSRIALVGRNGAGKSTLLRIIAGVEQPDSGQIIVTKGTKIGYLAQNANFNSNKSIYDTLLEVFKPLQVIEKHLRQLEMEMSEVQGEKLEQLMKQYDELQHQFTEQNGYGYQAEIRSILHHFKFSTDDFIRNVNTLSGGQKTRLALAKMLLENPDLLILDEPTNHLDIDTLSWLESYLKNYKGALLIVSHDRYFLDKVVNEVYELSHHELSHYAGNYSYYTIEKAKRLEILNKQYEAQQSEIKKMELFIAKNIARSSTTKRAQSRQKQLEKLERIEKPHNDEKSAIFQFPIKTVSGNVVCQLEDTAIGYENHIICEPINLDIRRQDAIAIVGPNGIGKSTLLKSVIGAIPLLKGHCQLGTNVEIGYYDQEQAHLNPKKTVLNELWDEYPTTPEKEIRTILGQFLFSGEDVKKTVGMLSGGEKARLLLAKLSMQQENFLILDEPTNHLDLDSKEVLENALIDYEGTLLFVSHDRYFINRIATKVIELSEQGASLYLGDYDYYISKKEEEEEKQRLLNEEITVEKEVSKGSKNYQQSKVKNREIRKIKRQVEDYEKQLSILETEHEKIEKDMFIASESNDTSQLIELQHSLEQVSIQIDHIMEQWEIAAEKLENVES